MALLLQDSFHAVRSILVSQIARYPPLPRAWNPSISIKDNQKIDGSNTPPDSLHYTSWNATWYSRDLGMAEMKPPGMIDLYDVDDYKNSEAETRIIRRYGLVHR